MTIITQSLANETLEVTLTSESQELLDQLLNETLFAKNLVMDLPSATLDQPEEDDEQPDEDDKPKRN
ncbi:hypothetical protein BKI52_29900 [marine bacterium AO1-C]|nr:hypothetical protein BKI52_29900 [marine bacterium AO1-C]